MDDWARNLPQSKPGTLFGVPLAKLRDPSLQRMALTFLGAALLIAIFVPFSFKPFAFYFSSKLPFGKFKALLWPLLAGASYLFVAIAPKDIREKVPPIVLQWLPFGVSYAGVLINGVGGLPFLEDGPLANNALYGIGMSTLIFGLLARLANPEDQVARIIILVGAVCLLVPFADSFDVFDAKGALFKLYGVLNLLVLIIGMSCAVYVVPARRLPPAMQAVDAFAPHVTALLLMWLVAQIIVLMLATLIHIDGVKFVDWFLMLVRSLLMLLAYFGVLMLTAPAAYDEIMKLVRGNKGSPPQGGYGGPPQGGYGGPPQGGYGGPPQGGPPPGFGGPPQGGPPPGFGGPPQGGPPPGGWQPPQ